MFCEWFLKWACCPYVSFFSLEKNLNDGISMTFNCSSKNMCSELKVMCMYSNIPASSCCLHKLSILFGKKICLQLEAGVWGSSQLWPRISEPKVRNFGVPRTTRNSSAYREIHPNHSSLLRGLRLFSYLLMMEGMAVLFTASLVMCCWLWSVCAQQGFAYSYIL